MSSKSLQVVVCESKKDGTFEGIARLEGGTAFKLTKSRSADTRFSTRSSLTQSAKTFAKRFDLELAIANKSAATAIGAKNGGKVIGKNATQKKTHAAAAASDNQIA